MLMIKANNLTISYGNRDIISDATLYMYKGERIGLVGRNGEGKSTLLSLLASMLDPDTGTIERYGSIAYIPQLDDCDDSANAIFSKKWGLPEKERAMISGGESTRRKIASALSSNANVIIADEPTSHLDVEGIEQLEVELLAFDGALLLTSHDKVFLNKLCTQIWEIERGKLTFYEGNYDAYLVQKGQQREKEKKDYGEYVRERERLTKAARQLKEKSNAIKKAPSRMGNSEARLHRRSSGQIKAKLNRAVDAIESRIEQLETKERPKEADAIIFDVASFSTLHAKRVVQFQGCSLQVGDRLLKSHIHGEVLTQSTLAIIGPNGSGKSTLVKKIVSLDPELRIAGASKIGYFSQHLDNLIASATILDNVRSESRYNETFIRTVLSRLAFKRDDVHKRVEDLSGGERMRASLAKVFLGDYNVLVLDEPSNYLDLQTKDSLIEVMKAYPGTIVMVTHDRSMVDALATHVLSMGEEVPRVRMVDQRLIDECSEGENDHQDELLTIELEIIDVLGKLSKVLGDLEKQGLESRFQQLCSRKARLKSKS
ncbi:MAG: ABC-F family ATP-binding cassette domain-containing protein [Candidatus Cohnella colombiensis]|uniref:ABC-F family ATP-binding cassette domain-containing protein n=1 Tax=Candidatus Cohnella colombiensis TaxID=3121368 RepID=A0AA95EV86_9BACL|nr:MAG: ABC-F family ATP-binding cassette domain-containing protein [Cohnella sp.]